MGLQPLYSRRQPLHSKRQPSFYKRCYLIVHTGRGHTRFLRAADSYLVSRIPFLVFGVDFAGRARLNRPTLRPSLTVPIVLHVVSGLERRVLLSNIRTRCLPPPPTPGSPRSQHRSWPVSRRRSDSIELVRRAARRSRSSCSTRRAIWTTSRLFCSRAERCNLTLPSARPHHQLPRCCSHERARRRSRAYVSQLWCARCCAPHSSTPSHVAR